MQPCGQSVGVQQTSGGRSALSKASVLQRRSRSQAHLELVGLQQSINATHVVEYWIPCLRTLPMDADVTTGRFHDRFGQGLAIASVRLPDFGHILYDCSTS